MKISIVTDVFPPEKGGIQTFVWGLAKNLSRAEKIKKVSVLALNEKKVGFEEINKKIDVYRIRRSNMLKNGFLILKNLFKKRNYSLVHSATLYSAGFFVSVFSMLSLRNVKTVVNVHGLDALSKLGDPIRQPMVDFSLRETDKVVTNSNFVKEEVKKVYNPNRGKMETIYPGVSVTKSDSELDSIKKKYEIDKNSFKVLFVGRLVKRKRVEDLIRAVNMIDKNKKIQLLVVGDGPELDSLVSLTKKFNEDRVLFLGQVPEVSPLYEISDVFSMPSKYIREKGDVEGLGLVFLEAQKFGLPVIGTRSGGIPEAINPSKSGFIVPEENPEMIKKKITLLMNNSDLREKMGDYAKSYVNKKFNWNKCINKYLNLYEGLIG